MAAKSPYGVGSMYVPPRKARLVLRDGAVFEGALFGASRAAAGEVVFNTGMVGYPEAITDPSYFGQILALTYPLVGNYGVPSFERDEFGIPRWFESERIQVRGLVVSSYQGEYHHWNAERSLGDWLGREGVPGLFGVDTRALALHLRERGTVPGKIVVDGEPEPAWYDPAAENVVRLVSTREPRTYGAGGPRIALLDCGVKNNIIRCLLRRRASVQVLPWDSDLSSADFDALVLSNGPGDPEMCAEAARGVRSLLGGPRPIFGICLGCQLLGLAAGGRTFKLPFGHRGQNQPVLEAATGRWAITSQNHGYALDPASLPEGWEVWFTNGNDGTVEGIRLAGTPHRAVQFHPEAVCGPVDTGYLFDELLANLRGRRD